MDIEVNWPKYEEARREEALKGDYLQLEIIIPSISHKQFAQEGNSPICHLVERGSTFFDIAILYKTLGLYMENLDRKYLDACQFARDTLGVKSIFDAEEEPEDEDI